MIRRPALLAALTVLLAGSSTGQTPETPGAAGAVAAVNAFVAAQRARDWPAVLRLLSPDAVAAVTADARAILADARTVLADSARIVSEADYEAWSGDPTFATARQSIAILDGAPLDDDARAAPALAELMALQDEPDDMFPPNGGRRVQAVGAQLEGDLAHVVVRTAEDSQTSVQTSVGVATLRRGGERWQLVGTGQAFWFVDSPGLVGLASWLHRIATGDRIEPYVAAPDVPNDPPPPTIVTATPETRAPAGAEAAVLALVAAQRAENWPAVFRLVKPSALAETARGTRDLARLFHHALVDSATVAAADDMRREPERAALLFRMARRLDAVLVPGDSLSDLEVAVRTAEAGIRRNPNRRYAFYSLRMDSELDGAGEDVDLIGSVAETDSLVHVVGRSRAQRRTADPSAQIVSMRWTGDRWATAYRTIDAPALRPLEGLIGNWMELIGDITNDQDEIDRQYEDPGTLSGTTGDDE